MAPKFTYKKCGQEGNGMYWVRERPMQTNYSKKRKYYRCQQKGSSNGSNVILHFYVPVKKPASAGMAKRFECLLFWKFHYKKIP
jgi:hypothetical protein